MYEGTSRDEIPAGFDFFETLSEKAVFRFDKLPIPAGFFAPKSQEFTETVRFKGRPLSRSYFGELDITHIDTIIERRQSVELPPPYPCTPRDVPIAFVALALESTEPIEVRVGKRTELWDVQVELSKERPSRGTMTITKTSEEGGVFDSELTVFPRFRFIRRCDGKERVLDVGALQLSEEVIDKITLRSSESPWLHDAPDTLKLPGLNDNFIAGAPSA